MQPTTTEMMKHDAPRSSPMANEKVFDRRAEKVEKTSGEPFLWKVGNVKTPLSGTVLLPTSVR